MKNKGNQPKQAAELRRQAEKIAREKAARSPENVEFFLPEEIRQILHELHVHQIELEMQNDELRRSQTELDAARARYFDLYDLAPVGYCTLSEKGLILEANLTAATLLDVPRGALVNQPITRFILKEHQDIYYRYRKQLFETHSANAGQSREPQTCELLMIKKDGELFWVHLEATIAQDADGATVCRVMLSDATESKRAETALRDSVQIHRAIGESIDYGIWICDADGHNIYASESFLKLVGLTQKQCSIFGWSDVLHPDDAERTMTAWKECTRTGDIWDMEHRFRGVDGQWHPILARGVPVRNERGKITYWAGINLDISNLKKTEVVLEERTKQLLEANKELESFTYSVSHDLRAPLRAIEGYSRMLVKKYGDNLNEDAARMMSVIRSSTEKMGILIDDLLSFSRVLGNSINVSEIDMEMLAREVWEDMRAANPERELEVMITNILPGLGDRSLIRQVIFNLFSNAVKFTRGREPGIIEMSCYAENGKVVYCLKDNGAGFNMAFADKLFGVFQRLHSDEEYEGTGVGLAIVQRIVQRHGGCVWALGEIDKGASFYFTLSQKENAFISKEI